MLESLLNRFVRLQACNFIKKTPTHVFSCEIRAIFKSTYFIEHLRTTACAFNPYFISQGFLKGLLSFTRPISKICVNLSIKVSLHLLLMPISYHWKNDCIKISQTQFVYKQITLTHYSPVLVFCTPHPPGGIEKQHRAVMG